MIKLHLRMIRLVRTKRVRFIQIVSLCANYTLNAFGFTLKIFINFLSHFLFSFIIVCKENYNLFKSFKYVSLLPSFAFQCFGMHLFFHNFNDCHFIISQTSGLHCYDYCCFFSRQCHTVVLALIYIPTLSHFFCFHFIYSLLIFSQWIIFVFLNQPYLP